MKIPKLYLHEAMVDWLYTLFFQGECLGFQTIIVTDSLAESITFPAETRYALLIIECDPAQADKTRAVRFLEDGTTPDANTGMPLGDLGVYEVKGKENMEKFRMIGITPGFFHTAHIEYFG